MFNLLGIKIDKFLCELMKLNRKMFWYKFYGYYYCKKQKSKQLIDTAYKIGYLYKWQYKKLIRGNHYAK